MRLYQIPLPMTDNAGNSYAMARVTFLREVLAIAGGYTLLPMSSGMWRDPETGKDYADQVIPMQVATTKSFM